MTDRVVYLAEAALAEDFDKVEVVNGVLLDSWSPTSSCYGRTLHASAAVVVHDDNAHPGPGAGSICVRPSLHRAGGGRSLYVWRGSLSLVVRHQHHLARHAAEDLIDVGVNIVITVTVAVAVRQCCRLLITYTC